MSDLLLVCRLTLICVLTVAGLAKLRERRRFATAPGDLTYLPDAARPALAILVPAAELIAAVLLALPRTLTAGLAVAAALCAAFSAVAVHRTAFAVFTDDPAFFFSVRTGQS
ncbi:MauE/DoxX family redox-associated membrane protein [Streptomyces sp. NPDC051286]|uniref:MauE/DoxX family redox-associated membrane protein n=1 Tax=Streptomyces sp. NPDC051286 TaxID=3365647 RepID=UPI0037B6A61E